VNRKASYDADDMKVSLDGPRLRAVGKTLPADMVDAESVGVMVFRGEGPQAFRRTLGDALRQPGAERAWYLSAIDTLARDGQVYGVSVSGLRCWEIDDAEDLAQVRRALASRQARSARAGGMRALTGRVVAAEARDERPETGRLPCA
jgi:choline kinase